MYNIYSTDATSVNNLQYQLFLCNEERWIPVNFHLVKTACLCMSFVLTTRLSLEVLPAKEAMCAKSKRN